MQTDYSKHTAEDFIHDDFFIRSCYTPTVATEKFWENLLKNELINAEEFNIARLYLQSISVDKQKMNPLEKENLHKEIFADTVFRKRKRRTLYLRIAAACFIFLIGSSVFLFLPQRNNPQETLLSVASQWSNTIPSEQIELELSQHERITITEKNAIITHGIQGDIIINEELLQNKKEDKETSKKRDYNRLSVPHGRRSTVMLSDGTKIWINAGSFIIYPSEFDTNKREIYVDGEVFLDVVPDKNRPFHVITDDMNIKVLGTSFNVLAYKEDKTHSVVLVEGSVSIQCFKEQYLLNPNNIFLKEPDHRTVNPVENAKELISWKDGIFRFNNEKLSIILTRLARYYGVEIEINANANDLRCTGSLALKDELPRVLKVLQGTAPVNYHIQENGIYYFEYEP